MALHTAVPDAEDTDGHSSGNSVANKAGFDAVFARISELVPLIRERVAEIEERRRLPDGLVALLREAGAFRLAMPAEWGGPDFTPVEQTRIVEEVSRADASAGWCVMIGMDSGIFARYLDPDVARQVFPRLDMITAGWLPPAGVAQEVDGGYVVNGHWRFGSGCTHADWLVGGCVVHRSGQPVLDAHGAPAWRVIMALPSDFTIVDTWRTTGLAGSGSNDYTATNLFVRREHSFSFDEPVHPGPLTRWRDAINRKMPGVPLGAARAALDYVHDVAAKRRERPSGVRWPDSPRVQRAVGECEMRLAAARSFVYASLEEQWAALVAGTEPSPQVRAAVALARYNAFRTARGVAADLYDLIGGKSVYTSATPLDRIHRDLVTACQHVVGQSRMLEHAGQLLLGGTPDYAFI
jgi:indole-3-acetate monooxygenase